MRIGIFAKTFDGRTADDVLPRVKAAGYAATQYNFACSGLASLPDAVSDAVIADLGKSAENNGVVLVALSATYNMVHPSLDVRKKGHHGLSVAAAAAAKAGIPMVTLCTGTRDADDQWKHHPDNASPDAWRDLLASMQTAITVADRFNVDLGIEPELANVVNSAAQARRLLDDLRSPRLRIVLDPANLFEVEPLNEQRRIVSHAVDLLGDRIAMAHAKDRAADGTFVAAGSGVMDYPFFLHALKDSGFTGPVVTHGLSAAEAPRVCAFLHQQMQEAGIEVTT